MSSSILFIILALILLINGFASSYNRLIRTNVASFISLSLITFIYVFDKYLFNLRIFNFISTLFFSIFKTVFSKMKLTDAQLSVFLWSVFVFALFLIVYLLLRLILHFTLVGRNPSLKSTIKIKWLYGINLVYLVISSLMISGFIAIFTRDIMQIPYGFFEKIFQYFYGGIKI